MKFTFEDVLGRIQYQIDTPEEGYVMPFMPKLNKLIGNITKSDYTVVSGMQSSGKASFVDETYVISVLLQWYLDDDRDEKPLRIVYFSMKDDEFKKIQLLLCNYMMVVHNYRVDIPTLNSQAGKLFDIEDQPEMYEALKGAKAFFDTVIDEGILEIIDGTQTPTQIYNHMLDVASQFGTHTKSQFKLDEENSESLVMAIIDSAEYLDEDSTEFSTLRGADLHEKMNSYINVLYKKYFVNCIMVVPAKMGYVTNPKDTEPKYRQLDVYGSCKKGIILYNPIAEENKKYLAGEDVSTYVSAESKLNVLRYWEIVRNVDGIDSIRNKVLFVPGTSFMLECDERMGSIDEVTDYLFDSDRTPFYVDPDAEDNNEDEEEDEYYQEDEY